MKAKLTINLIECPHCKTYAGIETGLKDDSEPYIEIEKTEVEICSNCERPFKVIMNVTVIIDEI